MMCLTFWKVWSNNQNGFRKYNYVTFWDKKQDVIIIGAIIKSPIQTRSSLGVGMTHMGQTLQTKRFRTWLFLFLKFHDVTPRLLYYISGEPTWPKEQEYNILYDIGVGFLTVFKIFGHFLFEVFRKTSGAHDLHTMWFSLTQGIRIYMI